MEEARSDHWLTVLVIRYLMSIFLSNPLPTLTNNKEKISLEAV